jgi:hypothetical protein
MIFSENRYPPRIKSRTGFFAIVLQAKLEMGQDDSDHVDERMGRNTIPTNTRMAGFVLKFGAIVFHV